MGGGICDQGLKFGQHPLLKFGQQTTRGPSTGLMSTQHFLAMWTPHKAAPHTSSHVDQPSRRESLAMIKTQLLRRDTVAPTAPIMCMLKFKRARKSQLKRARSSRWACLEYTAVASWTWSINIGLNDPRRYWAGISYQRACKQNVSRSMARYAEIKILIEVSDVSEKNKIIIFLAGQFGWVPL